MRKIILTVISVVLAAAMVLGLSACSIDIHTDGKNPKTYTIDLGEFDLDELSSALKEINFDEISPGITEGGEQIFNMIDEFMAQAGEGAYQIAEDITEGKNSSLPENLGVNSEIVDEIREGTDEAEDRIEDSMQDIIKNEDEIPEEAQEALDSLKDALDENGLGAFYEGLIDQIFNSSEMQEAMESGSLKDLSWLFGGSSSGNKESEAEAAPEAEVVPEEAVVEEVVPEEAAAEEAIPEADAGDGENKISMH